MYYDPKNSAIAEVEYVTPAYGVRHVPGLYDGTTLEEINPKGVLVQPGTLIEWTEPPNNNFCTPLYSNLPVSYPPYECSTEVNTAGVTNFNYAWSYCSEITEFPCLDTSSGINFNHAWSYTGVTTMPLLDTSQGVTFNYSFYYASSLTGTFPLWDFTNARELRYTFSHWDGSGAPLEFAPGCFDSCTKDGILFGYTFYGHQLTQESIDNILNSLDTSGVKGGSFNSWDSEASAPSQEVIDGAVYNLFQKGWNLKLPPDGGFGITGPDYSCSTMVDTSGVENFIRAWYNCISLTEFPLLDVSDGKIFYETWSGCYNLTSFAELDVSNGSNFFAAWRSCSSLESFPELDLSGGINFLEAWKSCFSLTSFPVLDLSSGVDFSSAWQSCISLTSFPLLDVSSGVNFPSAWLLCTSLTSFPALDVSSGVNFNSTWSVCINLTSFPELDVSNGRTFYGTWSSCSGLTSFPALDMSSGVDFRYTWGNCTGLTSFPVLDVSSGVTFIGAWQGCTGLTSFPELDLSSGMEFYDTWRSCSSLTSFPANMFDTCTSISFADAWLDCALDEESVDNILVSLDTAGQSNGTLGINGGTSSAPGTAGAAAKASLIAKGWTVTTN